MAGIQTNGISGLDINNLVTQLVSAEAAPIQQRITRHEVAVTTKISALGSLKGALSAFKGALEPLKSVDIFQARKATSADTDYFTVSASSKATAGTYDVEVVQLAKAHQLGSAAFDDGATAEVGQGTLTISVGEESFDVVIDEEGATLSDVRNAINSATDNKGVSATLLNTADGTRLILTSKKTGADHAVQVSATGGLGELIPNGMTSLTELEPAQNALIRIADFPVESNTNVFEDAIDGVTITAKKSSDGEEIGLDVAFDSAGVQGRIQKFVTEYNNLQSQLAKLGGYNAETKTGGPMLGDALLRGVESEIRRSLTEAVDGIDGSYRTLASVGIATSTTGALTVDSAKLTKALNEDPEAVAKLFGSEDGVAAKMFAQVERRLSTNGDIEGRNTSLKDELKGIEKDKEMAMVRLEQLEARYRKQFTALETLLAQMQSTSSYLGQQLANLPKIGD